MPRRNVCRDFLFLLTLMAMSVGLAGCPFDSDSDSDDGDQAPPAASSDADLAGLAVSDGSLDPTFSAAVTDYAVTVEHAVASITVTATTSDAAATLTTNGTATNSGSASAPIDLSVGTTQIDIVVTAEDGTTTKTYALAVTRAPSSDASLSGLELSVTALNESFDPGLNTYTADVGNEVDSTTVTATASDAAATLTTNGTATNSGTASDPIPLAVGDNLITVTVTAEDGTTTESYTIMVTRAEAPVVTSSVELLVLDGDGRLVQDAILNVESTGEMDVTGADGRATVPVIQQSRELIRISAPGYLPQTLPLDLPVDARPSVFKVGLIAEADPQQIAAAETGGTANGDDGASVTLPAGALVDGAGNPVTGPVDVFVTPLDVSDERELVAFPGGFEAENAAGEPGYMLSFGTVDFRFEQGGEVLSLASGQTATIELPLYVPNDADGTALTEGAAIPLWSLDETTSLWIEEGQGTVVASAASPTGLALRGDATHFSWWNADKFRRPGEIRVTFNCTALGTDCTSAGNVPSSNLECNPSGDGTPRIVWRTVISGGSGGQIDLPVPADTNLDCDAESDGRLSASTSPDPVNAPAGTVLPVEIILGPAYAGTGAFTPGERLRGEMTTVGDTQVWRFNGIAGEIFRVTAYPAATGLSEPGLTGELGATVAVFSGMTELASAIFESTIAGEIEVELPADGEYEVRFTADGKVPGWYVATTELDAPEVGTSNLRVAFTGLDTRETVRKDRLFTVPSGASPFLELSRDFIPSSAGGVKTEADVGTGFVEQRPFYQEVSPGTIVYLADHEVAGRFELYLAKLDDPGNVVKLSGPEMDREDSINEINDFKVSPADPTLIVYSVYNLDGLGQLYLVDTDDPGNPIRIAEPADYPNYDGEQRPFYFVAGGTAIVYQANSTVTDAQGSDGQLFLVELANPGVATRVNGPIDEAAGEHLRNFDRSGAVSADGNLIAYSVQIAGDSGALFLVDVTDPGNAVQIEDDANPSEAAEIAFSPDGTRLVYMRESSTGSKPLWFADISDPAAPGIAQRLAGTADFDKWFVSPGSDYVVIGRNRSTVIQRVTFAAPDVRESWNLPPANARWIRLRFTPDGQGILVQVEDTAADQAQLWMHRWADDRDVQTRLGPSPDSLLSGDRGVTYFDLADDGTLYYTADVGSINIQDEIYATSLAEPDNDRIKIAEWHDTFRISQGINRLARIPTFIILEAGQNTGL